MAMRLLCLLLFVLSAVAEEPDIAQLLASKDERLSAWGSYHVAEKRAKGFQPQLEKLLKIVVRPVGIEDGP